MADLTTLNNHLFQQLGRLNDPDLSGEKLTEEIQRSKAVTDISKEVIANGKLVLEAVKFKADLQGMPATDVPNLLGTDQT